MSIDIHWWKDFGSGVILAGYMQFWGLTCISYMAVFLIFGRVDFLAIFISTIHFAQDLIRETNQGM